MRPPFKALFAVVAASLVLGGPAVAAKEPKPTPKQDTAPLVWPAPLAEAKIRWVAEYRSEFDVGAKQRRSFVDRLAGKGQDALWLTRPMSVAADDAGVLYVGDFGTGIVAIDAAAKKMWRFTANTKIPLPNPIGMAAGSKGLYVCDANTNTLALLDKDGNLLLAKGPADGINRPVGVAVDEAQDLVVVVNGGEHTVLLLDRQLKLKKKVGKRGTEEGQFNFPTYCCIVPGTGFAVVDTGNFRVQLFDFAGKFVRAFGKIGDVTGTFSRPKGIAVDPDGQIYVIDSTFANFQVFRADGQILTFVGQGGAGRGEFQVPTGIAITKGGAIYVADQINRRVQVFQYLGGSGEKK